MLPRLPASLLASLAVLAGCGSDPDRPSGPDPGGETNGPGTALVFADPALQSAVDQAAGEADAAGAGHPERQGPGDRRPRRHRPADAAGGPGPVRQRDPRPVAAVGAGAAALSRPGEQPRRGGVGPVVAAEPAGAAAGRQLGDRGVGAGGPGQPAERGPDRQPAGRGRARPGRGPAGARRERGVHRAGAGGHGGRGPARGSGPSSGRLGAPVLLEPAPRGQLPVQPRGALPRPGDRGGGEPVLAPGRGPLRRRLGARLPGAPLPLADQRRAGPVSGRDEGGLQLRSGTATGRSTSWTPTAAIR